MTSISARLRAIEESIQRDQSDDEFFDFNEFMLKRNQEASKDQVTANEIRAQFEHSVEEPEPETTANPRQVAIDSDSDEDQEEPPVANEIQQTQASQSESDSDDDVPSSPTSPSVPRKLLESTTSKNPVTSTEPKPRTSRLNAEQELARMRRKLDLDIEIYTKRAPSVSEFITKFRKPGHLPRDEQDSDDLEIIDDVPRPLLPPPADPRVKLFTDLFKLNKQQIKEQEKIKKKRWAERNGILDDEEQNEEDLSETQLSEIEGTMKPLESEKLPLDTSDDVLVDTDSDNQVDSSLSSSQVTEVNETQVEAPIDPKILRQIYRQQQKIFNDSDSESEASCSDIELEMPQLADTIADRDELEKLSPSQQYAELRRRHQQKREIMLQMLEQQAQESDEEGGDVAVSDDEDDDEGPPVENLIDDTKQDVQEDELHTKFVDTEREMDEYVTNMIRRDVVNGGWRTKNLYDESGMLQDDGDSLDEENLKRRERIRKSLLENSAAGKLIKDPKMSIYAEAIVDSYMPEKQAVEEVFDSVEDCFTSMFGAKEPPPSSPTEHVEMLPTPPQVASSLPKPVSFPGTTRSHRESVLTRALPSAHAVPRLATTHVKRRAKLSEPSAKTPKLSIKPIGLGY